MYDFSQIKTSAAHSHLIIGIISRAKAAKLIEKPLDLAMDLELLNHVSRQLDLNALLNFSDPDFAHDIHGIAANLNRSTGHLQNNFRPRSFLKKPIPQPSCYLTLTAYAKTHGYTRQAADQRKNDILKLPGVVQAGRYVLIPPGTPWPPSKRN
jgi:hypothetical protein